MEETKSKTKTRKRRRRKTVHLKEHMFDTNQHSFCPKIPDTFINAKVNNISGPHNYSEKEGSLVLMVFHATEDEIKSGKLLSNHHGELFHNVLTRAKLKYKQIPSIYKHRWVATHFNYVEDDTNFSTCFAFNKKRLNHIIKTNKPDFIWTFSRDAFTSLVEFMEEPYTRCTHANLLGTPVPLTTGQTLFPIMDFEGMFNFVHGDKSFPAYLLGYMINNVANALNNGRIWSIEEETAEIKCTYVDNIKKFRVMLRHLRKFDVLSVDTETTGLEKVQVKMLTIQFAVTTTQAFFLPVMHYDTPFTVSEVDEILFELRKFFTEHSFKHVVFHNTNYDINVIRSNLKINHIPFDTWDTQDGEYVNDENMAELTTALRGKSNYYNLLNVSVQYGFMGYVTGVFGKSDRKTIMDVPLSTPGLIEYGCYDVCIPLALYHMQKERAKFGGHDQYEALVGKQLSDTQHIFSVMNQVGTLIDTQYLWWLDSDDSPFVKELNDAEESILSLPEVKEAETLIRKDQGTPQRGLFGDVTTRIFDLSKKKHVQTLFFDVLGLEKVSMGKNGTPNIDTIMQEKYKDHPTIIAYSKRSKVLTLINNYVTGIIKRMSRDKDAMADSRIRSSYRYHNVVSYRSSSSNPNLQNIPEHGTLGKYIKRCFITPPGTVIIKIDYSAAEIRCLGNVANDKNFGEAFMVGVDLRKEYLSNPTDDRRFKMSTIGDVHMVNANYFFNLAIATLSTMEEVKKLKLYRQQIKGIVFGLVYGRGIKAMAAAIGKDEEYTTNLVNKFYERFHATHKWLKDIEKQAQENLFVENPMGARRNLWPYMTPNSWDKSYGAHTACDRRARNSPIQGYASMITYCAMRLFEKQVHKRHGHKADLPIQIFNTVHDSTFVYVNYENIFEAIHLLKVCMTTGVQKVIQRRHGDGVHFPIPIEIDFELGGSLATCQKFDGRLSDLYKTLEDTLVWQNEELRYDVDIPDTMDIIFGKNGEQISSIFKKQVSNGYFDLKKERSAMSKRHQ